MNRKHHIDPSSILARWRGTETIRQIADDIGCDYATVQKVIAAHSTPAERLLSRGRHRAVKAALPRKHSKPKCEPSPEKPRAARSHWYERLPRPLPASVVAFAAGLERNGDKVWGGE